MKTDNIRFTIFIFCFELSHSPGLSVSNGWGDGASKSSRCGRISGSCSAMSSKDMVGPMPGFSRFCTVSSAPLGVWAVPGNHESHGGRENSMPLFGATNIQVLRNGWAEGRPGFAPVAFCMTAAGLRTLFFILHEMVSYLNRLEGIL